MFLFGVEVLIRKCDINKEAGLYQTNLLLFLMGSSAILPNDINKVQWHNRKAADLLASMTENDIIN